MEFLREHTVAVLLSTLLHGVLIVVFTVGLDLPSRQRALAPVEQVAIEATVVDETLIRREMARLEALEQEEQRRREEQQRLALEEQQRVEQQAEEARRQLEEEQQRLEQVRVQREEAELQEQRRLAELERQREAEEEAAREAERQRLAEEERRRQEELERQRRAAEEARRQAEREAELARALAAEEEARRRDEDEAMDEYIRLIHNRIQQNWITPASVQAGIQCTVHVTQIPGGDVVSVRIGQCNGDEAVIRSIEVAVRKSSPLPMPRIRSLFERELEVIFRPEV